MAFFPVSWLPPQMHDGKHVDSFGLITVNDAKGKLGEQAAADRWRNIGPRFRTFSDKSKTAFDLVKKQTAEPRRSLFIEQGGSKHFLFRLGMNDYRFHFSFFRASLKASSTGRHSTFPVSISA